MITLQHLFFVLALLGDGPSHSIVVKPEEPSGYAMNPSSLATPLRQDLTRLTLEPRGEGAYSIQLGDGEQTIELAQAPLSIFVPRVPSYVKGSDDLTRFALLQREFNRNDVKFGKTGEADEFKLANNCLKQGLWEVMLDKKTEKGSAMFFHGWFEFPRAEYAAEFERLNGAPLARYEEILADYPKIDGLGAPLEKLRKVGGESALLVDNRLNEAPIRFGEQKRKAKLVLTPGIETYADFASKAKQPIQTARFSEPGFYNEKDPVSFDLAWLAQPERAIRREVTLAQGGATATEVEIVYANGYRLIVADRDLGKLAPRAAAPDNDQDTLRLTFGIGTPDIYASVDGRQRELAEERPNWLLLLGPDGTHVDNHQAGIDRVFVWCEAGDPCTLHLYLVGYERIAVVNHLALPWIKL